jgi:hypothetical protein
MIKDLGKRPWCIGGEKVVFEEVSAGMGGAAKPRKGKGGRRVLLYLPYPRACQIAAKTAAPNACN